MSKITIPVSAIKSIIATNNRKKKEAYNNLLIEEGMSSLKERPPHYELENIDFNPTTRVAKIVFLETKKYRTIEKYITQNYEKYPIYSEWKTKTKRINKSIKLTNNELETLNQNPDFLLKMFSTEIILNLNNADLYPSWLVKDLLTEEYKAVVAKINESFNKFKVEKIKSIRAIDEGIEQNLYFIELRQFEQQKTVLKSNKIKQKICKIEKSTPLFRSILFTITTFGIYSYLVSNTRKKSLYQKNNLLDNIITDLQDIIDSSEKDKQDLLLKKDKLQKEIDKKREETLTPLAKAKAVYESKLKRVKPLESSYNDNVSSFVLLKEFSGLEYKKIVGCYIIHNRENDKYYVGQSKDVFKRLKQHFKGTSPNNIIFAEDYYSSNFQNKEDLFEIKIIPCSTKDELDQTEKELIELYDAWISGYNGTSGNS